MSSKNRIHIWIPALVIGALAAISSPALIARDLGINQPGAIGNAAGDAGINQPGAVGNAAGDAGINQPGAVGNAAGDAGINQPGAVGNATNRRAAANSSLNRLDRRR